MTGAVAGAESKPVRLAAGLTQAQMAERLGVSQAQVARIEKKGYESYTLNSLRRYVLALGEGYALEVKVKRLRKARRKKSDATSVAA